MKMKLVFLADRRAVLSLATGHRSCAWAGAVSEINSGLEIATDPAKLGLRPGETPMTSEKRNLILEELKSMEGLQQVHFARPDLHVEYQLNHSITRLDFERPLAPEIFKLLDTLGIQQEKMGFDQP